MLPVNDAPELYEGEERSALRELIAVATRLDSVQVELLTDVARMMLRDVQENLNPVSDLATARFAADFRNRLLIHHATNESKLTKKAFEYAFQGACRADNKEALLTVSNTFSGVDVTVEGVRFSLKTEAAKEIRADALVISKFSEARWRQQCTTLEELAEETRTRIPKHLALYDRVLVLRARDLSEKRVQYELVEIPMALLRRVANLTAKDFTPRTKQGGSSARVKIEGQTAYTLRLDGSDGKITLAGLRLEYCVRHAVWVIPTVAPASDEEQGLFAPAQTPPGN